MRKEPEDPMWFCHTDVHPCGKWAAGEVAVTERMHRCPGLGPPWEARGRPGSWLSEVIQSGPQALDTVTFGSGKDSAFQPVPPKKALCPAPARAPGAADAAGGWELARDAAGGAAAAALGAEHDGPVQLVE